MDREDKILWTEIEETGKKVNELIEKNKRLRLLI